ncbi:MAG: hypothetical protein ACOYOJ_05785 [Alsobacter sp.]
MATAVEATTSTTSTATDSAASLNAAFNTAIQAQLALQQVSITRQPELDASKEKPR